MSNDILSVLNHACTKVKATSVLLKSVNVSLNGKTITEDTEYVSKTIGAMYSSVALKTILLPAILVALASEFGTPMLGKRHGVLLSAADGAAATLALAACMTYFTPLPLPDLKIDAVAAIGGMAVHTDIASLMKGSSMLTSKARMFTLKASVLVGVIVMIVSLMMRNYQQCERARTFALVLTTMIATPISYTLFVEDYADALVRVIQANLEQLIEKSASAPTPHATPMMNLSPAHHK